MIWVVKTFIQEEITQIRRYDLNINSDRSIRRGPVRCGRKDKVILKRDSLMKNHKLKLPRLCVLTERICEQYPP
jgi:hypothetical protein